MDVAMPLQGVVRAFLGAEPLAFSEDTLARVQLLKNPFPYACPRHWISPSIFRATVYEISRLNDKLPSVNRSKFHREGACHARQSRL